MADTIHFDVQEAVKAFFDRFKKLSLDPKLVVDRAGYDCLGSTLLVCLQYSVSPNMSTISPLTEEVLWSSLPDDWLTTPRTKIREHCIDAITMAMHVSDCLDEHFKHLQTDIETPFEEDVRAALLADHVDSFDALKEVSICITVHVPALTYSSATDDDLPLRALMRPEDLEYIWQSAAPSSRPFRQFF